MRFRKDRTYLSYHMYKDYKECPQRFKWRSIEKRPKTVPDVPQWRILGMVWNDMLENFYNGQKFLLRGKAREWMREETERCFERLEASLQIVWSAKEREQYLEDALLYLDPIIETIKEEKLLSHKILIEHSMYANISTDERIGGRVDFILIRGDGKAIILDFKGTKHENGKYLSSDQLYWYALLYRANYGKLPDHLGFWLLRFKKIEWFDPSEEKASEFLKDIHDAMKGVKAQEYTATPSSKACQWCDYRDACPEKDEWEEKRPRRKRKNEIDLSEDDGLGEVLVFDV